jgi:hypothetical protein
VLTQRDLDAREVVAVDGLCLDRIFPGLHGLLVQIQDVHSDTLYCRQLLDNGIEGQVLAVTRSLCVWGPDCTQQYWS